MRATAPLSSWVDSGGAITSQFGARSGAGFEVGKTEFKLKIEPQRQGALLRGLHGRGLREAHRRRPTCADADFAPPADGKLHRGVRNRPRRQLSGRFVRTRGFVDHHAPYKLGQAHPAMRFWWNGVSLAGDPHLSSVDVQIVLIDRSNGTNNGNFDIELNYGIGGDEVPPSPTGWLPGFRARAQYHGPVSRAVRSFRYQRRADSLLLPRRHAASDLQLKHWGATGDSCCHPRQDLRSRAGDSTSSNGARCFS